MADINYCWDKVPTEGWDEVAKGEEPLPPATSSCSHEGAERANHFLFRGNEKVWRCLKCGGLWVEKDGQFRVIQVNQLRG